jgi:hypothetical protein
MTGLERAARMTQLFLDGGEYSTMEVAALCGYRSRQGAQRLIFSLSRVIPLYRSGSHKEGKWTILDG